MTTMWLYIIGGFVCALALVGAFTIGLVLGAVYVATSVAISFRQYGLTLRSGVWYLNGRRLPIINTKGEQ